MSAASTVPELVDLLSQGSVVLLPNTRAVRTLRSAFDTAQRARGLAAWDAPKVLSWTSWTRSLWSDLVVAGDELRLLLNPAQEHSLWTEIVAGESALASTDAVAELARSAWQLAAAYNATPRLRAFAATRDARLFANWADTFTHRCAERECLSPALLDDILRQHAQNRSLAVPGTLHLAGFGPLLPTQSALLEALRAHGTTIVEHTLTAEPQPNALRASVIAATERDEFTFAARWIRQFLTQRNAEGNSATVAILLPNLAEQRADLEVVLRDVLAPELQDIGADLSSTPWEFSTGNPLASLAMIADALDLARWATSPLPLDPVSALLRSPYLGRTEDRDVSARFDASILRRAPLLRPEIDLSSLLALAHRQTQSKRLLFPAWLNAVHQFATKAALDKPRSFAGWTEFLRGLLAAAQWPGDRTLNATEFEATRAWDGTLDLIATLDFAGHRVPFATVLQAIERQARTAPFAPPSTHAPVQVMSVEEAAGSCLDATIFLRATDVHWPPADRPHPLLGWALQHEYRMPGVDPSLAAAYAEEFTTGLLARSSSLIFTAAAENADGSQRLSPLIEQLNLPRLSSEDLLPAAAEPAALETIATTDDNALPPPGFEVRGGSTVLKLQAACGFLAFAELRLHSGELEARTPGFDARESGNLLHATLQRFWNRVVTRDALAAMTSIERDTLLTHCIDEAIARYPPGQTNWDIAYLDLQKDRLRKLLHHWLGHELERGPFTVLRNEQAEEITVGPLTLKVRIDRIDQVDDGVVFVDYKTGYAANERDWLDDRPNDPQLPLYSLLPEAGELKGLLFAKVRAGRDAKWLGYQTQEGIFPGSRSKTVLDLDEKVDAWRDTLTRLASDFYAGRADVNPKDFDLNCTRCAQRLLCRVDPEALFSPLSGADPADDEEALDG